jgi:hypothetical protein
MNKQSAAEMLIEASKNYNPTPEERKRHEEDFQKLIKDFNHECEKRALQDRKDFHEWLNKPYLI